jgi:hypothetical protein
MCSTSKKLIEGEYMEGADSGSAQPILLLFP